MKRGILIIFILIATLVLSPIPVGATAGNVFLRNRTAGRKVALTFDDGPHPIYTPRKSKQ